MRSHDDVTLHFMVGMVSVLMMGSLHAEETLDKMLSMPMENLVGLPAHAEVSRAANKDPATQPVLITVLTANDIRAFGYRNMADIMNALPGIFTTNDQIYTYVGARGISGVGNYNSRILITLGFG